MLKRSKSRKKVQRQWENYKCYCGRMGDVDEFGLCMVCSCELDVFDKCENCSLPEILKDGEICQYCEDEGVRCDTCKVWMKQTDKWNEFDSLRCKVKYFSCNKCKTNHCNSCFNKHMRRSCWSCAKRECPTLMKRCKTCKHKICQDCCQAGYCNYCLIQLIGQRSGIQFPKDIINLFQIECRGKRSNPLLKFKCPHNDIDWFDKTKCQGCNKYMCHNCLDEHYASQCPKCLNLRCSDQIWRTCFSCSKTICSQCPSGTVGTDCSCKNFDNPLIESGDPVEMSDD